MERQSVVSSNIASLGYDPDSRVLEVEFKRGDVYQYLDVPETVYQRLLRATSVGRAFQAIVKGGGYQFRKVEAESG